MGFFEKMRERRWRKKLMEGQYELTASGQCFINYCKKIARGTWTEKDYIYAYDKDLMGMVDRYNAMRPDLPITRAHMAEAILIFLGDKVGDE